MGLNPSRASLFMYLLYLDASGTPELQDRNSKHYVLLGLCMHEKSWFGLDKRLQSVKQRYCFPGQNPEEFEIHVKQFACTINEQNLIPNFESLSWTDRRQRVLEEQNKKIDAEPTSDKKRARRDKYKGTAPFVHLSRRERSQLLEDAIDIIAGYDGKIRLFAEAIDKSHPNVVAGEIDPCEQAFTQVVSRFDRFLQKKDRWKLAGSPRRSIDYGLLMLDQDESTQSTVEPLFRRFRQQGHPFGQMTHVIDVPFFGSSTKVGGLQLADVAAYVVRRYLDKGATLESHEERHFRQLFPLFDRDSFGKLHGIRHYVVANLCECLVCRERGHSATQSNSTPPSEPE